ncbi:unnamed protein product, partial [Rotaria magnacalcarata]
WINEQGILPAEQTGFRPGHNMAVRIVAIIDQIGQSLAKNTAAAALFVDFRTAFNQLWFNGLWLKLSNLQCPLYLIAWLRHYLRGRKAYINIKSTSSTMFNLSKGVPQGSCIGPVLFIIYHHDILEALSTIHWKHLFADDLAVLFSPSPYMSSSNMINTLTEQIKHVLLRLIKYSIKWKQPINFSKTNWILFHRQVVPLIPNIICEGHNIEHVKKFKYLGTILDAKLSFTEHIDYIQAKIRINMNIYKRLASTRMTSEQINYKLYNAFIRPYLQSILNFFPILSLTKQKQLEVRSKDLQKLVLSKYEKGEGPSDIFRHLNGALCLRTVKRWCEMIRENGSVELSTSPGRARTIRTKESIKKVKNRLNQKKKVTSRKLAAELNISRTSVRQILKDDLLLQSYRKIVEPLLTAEHKKKRKTFSSWVRTHFRKEDTMKILFSDEKLFDIDGIYNSQNDRIWTVSRAEADEKDGVKQNRKFPQKVMVWLAVCSKGVSPTVMSDEGTIDHDRYIREVLAVALKYGNDILGTDWTFPQDSAKIHIHHLT